jgi:putative lipoic acid-binding regulatory protein
MTTEHSLIEYPSDFPIKVFGHSHDDFTQAVIDIISRHDPEFKASSIEIRNSKTARYVSLTCTVRAVSRAQLDAIYQALTDHPLVKMAL